MRVNMNLCMYACLQVSMCMYTYIYVCMFMYNMVWGVQLPALELELGGLAVALEDRVGTPHLGGQRIQRRGLRERLHTKSSLQAWDLYQDPSESDGKSMCFLCP